VLDVAPWLIVAAGIAFSLRMPGAGQTAVGELALVVVIGLFFLLLLTQLGVAGWQAPRRRASLLVLGGGICLWAAGSAVLQTTVATASIVAFPSPSEPLFLASYAGLAAFLLMDVPRRGPAGAVIWLETTVVCGASVCVAAMVVLTPITSSLDRGVAALLIALLYPLIDLALAALVLSQVLLHQRDRSLRTALLVGGLALLAAADSGFAPTLSDQGYVSSIALDTMWGASFALIVAGARTPVPETSPPAHPVDRSRTLMLAAAAAVCVLVVSPVGAVGRGVSGVAVITLVSAGARMVVALREARGAADALRLSRTDELTGLANRRAVMSDTEARLHAGSPMGFMLLDLDGFKDINDSAGHATGDALLVRIADRLQRELGARMTVARLGGDEFALLLADDSLLTLLETAQEIRDILDEPHTIDGLQLHVRASIGITVREHGDTAATDLLRRADVAMYEAKASRNGALLYDHSQDGFSRARLQRAEELRRAIRGDELTVWYQPQIDAARQVVTSVEALVRWEHPADGLLLPISFLPDARRHGLMTELSVFVMERAIADSRRWADQGFDFQTSMNCAPPELLGDTLLPRLYAALDAAALPADTLIVEVTEDSFMSDPERARERLLELRSHHVQVAIDDYGTGFSSLAYLRDLPVQELKMDRSFISTMLTDRRSRVIVDTTCQMAHALGLRLVAEGVEEAATAAALVAMDIDVLQGIHVAAPMPGYAVEAWVREWSSGLAMDPAQLPEVTDQR